MAVYSIFTITVLVMGRGGPDNNGNVRFANIYTPMDEQDVQWAIHRQSYDYDSLNRLKSVTEYFISYSHPESQQFVQNYTHDRWGNLSIGSAQPFEIQTARNRLYSPAILRCRIVNDASHTIKPVIK